MQCWCPEAQEAECVRKVSGKTLQPLVRNGSKPGGSGNGVRNCSGGTKSSHGQGPVQAAAALGLFLGLGFQWYQIPAEVWLVQKNVRDHQCLV